MFSVQTFRKTLLLLLCLLGLIGQTNCASRPGHFGIIFTNGTGDIYRIPDNTQRKVEQLTFTPTIGEYDLLISKNGDRIVFRTDHYAGSEMEPSELAMEQLRHVYLLDTASKELVDITSVLEDEYPQLGPEFFMDWSPDQKQFVVVDYGGAGYEIQSFLELVDLAGKNRKDILIPATGEIPSLINGVKWSPDGKKFLLTRGVIGLEQQLQNPGAAIWVYDLESGKLTQITDYQDQCFPRAWSPTGRQILATCTFFIPYVEGVSGPDTVRIFDVENPGQPYERISFSPCYDPSWSPDGGQIALICDKGTGQAGLFIIDSTGNGIREIESGSLGNPAVLRDPIWSPDGTQLIYAAGSDHEHTNIYSIDSDGSDNRPLTDQEAFYGIFSVYPLP